MHRNVLLRHGESVRNSENRLTAWPGIGLSDRGCEETRAYERLLKAKGNGCDFDLARTGRPGDAKAARAKAANQEKAL